MRGLSIFLATTMLVQGTVFGSLAPLLPDFEKEFALSKGQAGLLVGMFPIGQGLVAIPMALLAFRYGAKRFSIASLVIFGASTVAFGVAPGYSELLGSRFLQGVAGGLCMPAGLAWVVSVVPPTRRGEMIGILSGGAAAGQMVGPVVGGAAAAAGRAELFAAFGVMFFALALVATRFPGPERSERQSLAIVRQAHRSRAILGGQWLIAVPSLGLGAMFVLAPLQLDRVGASAFEIAAAFLVTAFIGSLARPLAGLWADKRGLLSATTTLVLVPAPVLLFMPWSQSPLVVAGCLVICVAVWGALFGPTAALMSHVYEALGINHIFAFASTSLTAAAGLFVGSAAGGAMAKVAGDATVYGLIAGISVATVTALALRPRTASVAH